MSKDPCGHVRLSVRNLATSMVFYEQLFRIIGVQRVAEKGWTTNEGFGVWLIQAQQADPPYTFGAPGLHHLCFKVESDAEVDMVHDFLEDNGVTVTAPPQRYPQYTEEYYAVFFLDPDGLHLEVAYY